MRELGRHSVCTLVSAQPGIETRPRVPELDARSTSINQSEASVKTSLNSRSVSASRASGGIIAQAASKLCCLDFSPRITRNNLYFKQLQAPTRHAASLTSAENRNRPRRRACQPGRITGLERLDPRSMLLRLLAAESIARSLSSQRAPPRD